MRFLALSFFFLFRWFGCWGWLSSDALCWAFLHLFAKVMYTLKLV
jgi:hypothetical protein